MMTSSASSSLGASSGSFPTQTDVSGSVASGTPTLSGPTGSQGSATPPVVSWAATLSQPCGVTENAGLHE